MQVMAKTGSLLSFRHDKQYPKASFLTEKQIEETKDLITEGNWGIREYPYPREWASLIVHRCPSKEESHVEWRLPVACFKGYTTCGTCHEDIPAGIYALWQMQNMESIQIASERFGGAL